MATGRNTKHNTVIGGGGYIIRLYVAKSSHVYILKLYSRNRNSYVLSPGNTNVHVKGSMELTSHAMSVFDVIITCLHITQYCQTRTITQHTYTFDTVVCNHRVHMLKVVYLHNNLTISSKITIPVP